MPSNAPSRSTVDKSDTLENVLEANMSSKLDSAPQAAQRMIHRVAHRMNTETVRHAALGTTEILENVLSFLPPRTLFVVQRVSFQWMVLIAGSPSLQQKMFLRVSTKPPETWMFNDPKAIDSKTYPLGRWNRMDFPGFLNRKFRTVTTTEVESGSWNTSSDKTQCLYTPVSLNPFLFTTGHLDSKRIEGTWFFRTSLKPEIKLIQHTTLMDTCLMNLPSNQCCALMSFDARRSSLLLDHFWCQAVITSNKPITLRDISEQTLASHMWGSVNDTGRHVGAAPEFLVRLGTVPRKISLSEKIAEMDKQHGCKTVLEPYQRMQIVLALEEQTVFPVVLTDAEYFQCRPTENSSS